MMHQLENYALEYTQKQNDALTLFILHAEEKAIFVLFSPWHWEEHYKCGGTEF